MPDNLMTNESYWEPLHKPVCYCGECGGGIFYGNDYYDFDGDIVCEDCHRDYIKEHFRRCAE